MAAFLILQLEKIPACAPSASLVKLQRSVTAWLCMVQSQMCSEASATLQRAEAAPDSEMYWVQCPGLSSCSDALKRTFFC